MKYVSVGTFQSWSPLVSADRQLEQYARSGLRLLWERRETGNR